MATDLGRAVIASLLRSATLRSTWWLVGASLFASALAALFWSAADPAAVASAAGASGRLAGAIGFAGLLAGLAAATAAAHVVGSEWEHGGQLGIAVAIPLRLMRRLSDLAAALVGAILLALATLGVVILAAWPVLAAFNHEWSPGFVVLTPSFATLAIIACGGVLGAAVGTIVRSSSTAIVLIWTIVVAAPTLLIALGQSVAADFLPGGAALQIAGAGELALDHASVLVTWALSAIVVALLRPTENASRAASRARRWTKERSDRSPKAAKHPIRVTQVGVWWSTAHGLLTSRVFTGAPGLAAVAGIALATASAGQADPPQSDGSGFARLDTYALATGQPVAQLVIALTTAVLLARDLTGRQSAPLTVAVPRRWPRVIALLLLPAIASGLVVLLSALVAIPIVDTVLHAGGIVAEQRDGNLVSTAARLALAGALTTLLAGALTAFSSSAAVAGAVLIALLSLLPGSFNLLSVTIAPDGESRTLWLDVLRDLLPGQLTSWSENIPAELDMPQLLIAGGWLVLLCGAGILIQQRRDVR